MKTDTTWHPLTESIGLNQTHDTTIPSTGVIARQKWKAHIGNTQAKLTTTKQEREQFHDHQNRMIYAGKSKSGVSVYVYNKHLVTLQGHCPSHSFVHRNLVSYKVTIHWDRFRSPIKPNQGKEEENRRNRACRE